MSPPGDLLVIDRSPGQPGDEPIRWDGKPETLALLRERMPDCLDSYFPGIGILNVKTLRKVSDKKSVHDSAVVPTGWYVSPRVCRVHGQRYATIKPPMAS